MSLPPEVLDSRLTYPTYEITRVPENVDLPKNFIALMHAESLVHKKDAGKYNYVFSHQVFRNFWTLTHNAS